MKIGIGKDTNDPYGFCKYKFEDDYVHIYDLYVKPEYRNLGNAKKLLQQAIKEIRETGWDNEIQIVCNPTEDEIDKERLSKFYNELGLTVFEYYG
jgi:ribosomal protein S18 acetylase RimI-like enzyme